jgi:hypothetical protein
METTYERVEFDRKWYRLADEAHFISQEIFEEFAALILGIDEETRKRYRLLMCAERDISKINPDGHHTDSWTYCGVQLTPREQ